MKIKLKQFQIKRVEIEPLEVELPIETSYYFETGIRRAIRIVPIFTTWMINAGNKEEELYEFEITCVYNSGESKIEKFTIQASNIERILSDEKDKYHRFVTALVEGHFDERSKEAFESDLNYVIKEISK